MRLIRDRRCPNANAARSLVQAGTGKYYSSSFAEDNRRRIRELAKEIYDDLFVPPLETPIKTLDLPVAGRSYSSDSLKLILDMVEFVNGKPQHEGASKQRRPRGSKRPDILSPTMTEDSDGSATIEFLKNVRRASSRIAGVRSESLGLHPAVYFYSATGAYQPTAFLAAISFVQEMESKEELPRFVQYRHVFEELLLKYKYFINEIAGKYGSGTRGLTALTRLYRYLFDGVCSQQTDVEIIPTVFEDERLKFLAPIVDHDKGVKKDFTSERKSAVFLREAIEGAPRCGICNARVHRTSISVDHVRARREGGRGDIANAQLAHPYCNSIKDLLTAAQAT